MCFLSFCHVPAEGEQEGNQENWDCFRLTPPADASTSRAHRCTSDAEHKCGVKQANASQLLTSLGVVPNKGAGLGKESQMVILMSGLEKNKGFIGVH